MLNITENGTPKEEQETVCVWDAVDECWIIESSYRKHITKLKKQYGGKVEVVSQYPNGTPVMVRVRLDDDLVSFRKPISEERREKLRQQMNERLGKDKGQ